MRKHSRSHTALAVVLVAAACVLGQLAVVAPAVAGAGPEQAAGAAVETPRAATLTLDEAPPAAFTPVAPPTGTRDGWSVLMTEGFEGAFPSSNWTAFDADGATNGEYFWAPDDYKPYNGTKSAWPAKGGANGLDPYYYYYPSNLDSWMVYGPFDLRGYSEAKLEFYWWNQSESGVDWFSWMASGDGTNFVGYQTSGNSGDWGFQSFDLTAYVDDSSVWIAFVFESNTGGTSLDGPFVDDITLSALSAATTPPGAFNKTAPTSGDTGQPLNPSLSWGAATGAASYDYCYDTSNDNACGGTWTSTGTATSADLAGLAAGTTYYWQARAGNGVGTTYADGASTAYWNFTTTAAPATRDWTYMVYLDGDNNLEAAAVDDFLEMSSVGSTSQVAVVAQMDRIAGYDTSHDSWTDTRRFYVTHDMTPTAANGTSIGEANMGDPATLVDFVQWATTTYPADHYALVLWDHGNGWRSRALDEPTIQSIASDDTSGASLDMVELRNALSTLTGGGANPFELIGMDACLMAMIEVDNQLRPYADARVTSQETEPNDGAPLNAILAALVANPAITTEALATVYVDEYSASYGNGETQSAADLGADYATLNTAVNNFAAALLANGAANAAGIQAARSAVQDFFDVDYIDLYDFASRVSANVANPAIDNAAAAVMAAVGPATIDEHHGGTWPGAHGISIYFPAASGDYDARYDGSSGFLRFTVDTQWDEWVRAYYTLGNLPALGKTAPANGATGVALSPTLSWQAVSGALWYGYCYDTTDNDACDPISWQDAGTATSAGLTGLAPNTTYYWQVFASTSSLPVYGDADQWWSFTTGAPVSQQMTFHSAGAYDGWVLESGETTGVGGSRNSTATTARVGDDASDRQYRSLLHFNTAALPDNAVITGVTLRIKRQSTVGTSPLSTHGNLTVDAKTGSFGTAALANGDFLAAASGLNVGKFAKTAVSGWYRATLKSAVFPLVNRTGATQFRLRFTVDDNDNGAADYLAFYTGNSTAANRPDLIITYYLP